MLAQPLMSLNEQCGFPVRTFRDAAVTPTVNFLSLLYKQEPLPGSGCVFCFVFLLGGRFYLGAVLENCYPGLLDRNQTFKQQEGEKKSEKRR